MIEHFIHSLYDQWSSQYAELKKIFIKMLYTLIMFHTLFTNM